MAWSKPRTTFNAEELERHSGAQNRIFGLYEKLESYQPSLSSRSLSDAAMHLAPQQKRSKVSEPPPQCDSGLGDELPFDELSEDGPPKPPLLITDSENHDSGYGPESMDTDDDIDDVEKDSITKPSNQVTATNSKRNNQSKNVRRPKVNHLPKSTAPIAATSSKVTTATTALKFNKSVKLPKTTVPIAATSSKVTKATTAPRSVHTYSPSQSSVAAHRPNAIAAKVAKDLRKVKDTSRTWESTLDIIELQRNIQYFLPNKDGDTGLHLAVIHSQADLLDRLLFVISKEPRLKQLIDEQNSLFQTGLHLAAHTKQPDMLRKLLVSDASLHLTDHKGNTPLHIICRFNSTKCLEEILKFVKLNTILEVSQIRNNEGQTCMHIAAQHGNTNALRKLRCIGVDINMQDFHSGKTALHIAVEKDSLSDVQFMTETCKADVNATTYSSCTPLHTASGRGNIAIVAYLISMGANPELLTEEGDTALDLAGSEQVITLLTKAAALKWLC